MYSTTHDDKDELDLKGIFSSLEKHKFKIFFSGLLFALLATLYAYYQPNIYKSTLTMEIGLDRSKVSGQQDLLSMAMDPNSVNADTEIEILKSRYVINKALESLDFNHRYYSTNTYYKESELYENSPFDVMLLEGENISFTFKPIDQQFYLLDAKGLDKKTDKPWKVSKKFSFGKNAKTKHFNFILKVKNNYTIDPGKKYRFTVLSDRKVNDEILKNLSVSQASKSANILRISYSDNIALRSQEFCNALAQAYLDQGIERKTREATKILDFIDQQLSSVNTNLQDSELKLETFKKKSSMISLGSKAESVVDKMSEYDGKLLEANMEEQMLNSLYRQIKSDKNYESISAVGLNLTDTGVPELIQKLQEAVLEKKLLLSDYTPKHPEVKRLTRSISQYKKVISSTIKTLKLRVTKRKKLLQKTIKSYERLMEALPEKEKIFGGLKRKFIIDEKIYSYLLEKRATTAITKASTVNNNRILDSALIPQEPIEPKRKLIVLVGLMFGLIFGIVFAFLREFLNDKIATEEDVRKYSPLTLLGTIPFIKDKNIIKVFTSPKSVVSEAFRALRTNLQFLSKNSSMVISITSTVGSEGKTTIASNLASIISLTGKRTIILNLDMRKPTLHTLFNLPNKKGMSTLLSKKEILQDVIQKTKHDNLHIISSGPIPPNPSELIGSNMMIQVLSTLREKYDTIVIDTPPVGLVADATILMKESDVSLYVVRSEHSKKSYLSDMQHMQDRHAIEGLYLILNGVESDKKGYGYGYGYGYYEE